MLWTYLAVALIGLVLARLAFGVAIRLLHAKADARRHALEFKLFEENLATLREKRRLLAEVPLAWSGFRKFVVRRKQMESDDVHSFTLMPHDGKALPDFRPGQYLTFRLPGPDGNGQVIRCYSISDSAQPGQYRVTIKRMTPATGAAGGSSQYFHERIREGDIVDVRAPSGQFYLDPADPEPIVLIGGGIGVTPIFSMLATLVQQRSRRPIWFFYGVRNRRDHIFRQAMKQIAHDHPHINLRVCYSRAGTDDVLGTDYQVGGRVTVDLLRQQLPSNNFRFYYCGPGPMMEALTAGLKEWGVPEGHLHFEAFGPSSVKRVSLATAALAPGAAAMVTFRKTGVTRAWDGAQGSLLDLAERAGIAITSGCRAGNCGTCVVALHAGEVSYVQPPGIPLEARTCLTCLAHPKGDVTLDA